MLANLFMEPWEYHPALVHFPIAFLIGGVVLDLWARATRGEHLTRFATGLWVAGLLLGALSAFAGLVALRTIPAHTAEAHRDMYWHLLIQMTALNLFAWAALVRLRNWLTCLAAVLVVVAGFVIAGWQWRAEEAVPAVLYALLAAQLLAIPLLIWAGFRTGASWALPVSTWVGVVAVGVLFAGSYMGGELVYHGGAGVEPELLIPELREGHEHHHETASHPEHEHEH